MEIVSSRPPHEFVPPGQVAPYLPVPDQCVVCGDSEASHAVGYMAEAERQDQMLRDKLVMIRRQLESGDLTEREAADVRVAAIQHHLDATIGLIAEHFGGTQ